MRRGRAPRRAAQLGVIMTLLIVAACARPCSCVVSIAPGADADACLVVAVAEAELDSREVAVDDAPMISNEALDALVDVGKTAANVLLALLL